jgi:hypothetical protein
MQEAVQVPPPVAIAFGSQERKWSMPYGRFVEPTAPLAATGAPRGPRQRGNRFLASGHGCRLTCPVPESNHCLPFLVLAGGHILDPSPILLSIRNIL